MPWSCKIYLKDFALFDEGTSIWIAEAVNYTLKVRASYLNIKQTLSFKMANELNAGEASKTFAPSSEINKSVLKLIFG